MEIRKLGRTGLEITNLSFGTMELRLLDTVHSGRILNEAPDRVVNYFDTSPEYPMSEYFIGQGIAHRRSEYILATKCGDNMTGIGPLYRFDRKTILDNLDESLRLMKTDYIDVWQLHGVVPEFLPGGEAGEAMEAMREAKAAGKVRHLGLTVRNGGPSEYGYPAGFGYNSLPRFAPWKDIEVVQLVYGGLTRLSENVISKANREYNTGIIARGIIKKYDDRYDARFEASKISELFESGESRNDFLLRFALTHPDIASVLIGTRNIEHLVENVQTATRGPLSADIYREAKRRLDFAGVVAGPAEF
ncbi:MAG: aldo/keto reductase [Clostridiaceae bacterium]|nr:aldo/keto reductase [Clostridiaceae bacterium]